MVGGRGRGHSPSTLLSVCSLLCEYCLGLDSPEPDSEIRIPEEVIELEGGSWKRAGKERSQNWLHHQQGHWLGKWSTTWLGSSSGGGGRGSAEQKPAPHPGVDEGPSFQSWV